MVPMPVIASTTRIAFVFWTARPMALTSCAAPVDVSEACTKTPLIFGIAGEFCFNRLGLHHVAILGLEHGRFHAPSLHDFNPALAELAGAADQRLVAGGEEVLRGGFQSAGAGRDQRQHIVRCAEHFLQIRENAAIEGAKLLRPVMDIRTHHGVQCGRAEEGLDLVLRDVAS